MIAFVLEEENPVGLKLTIAYLQNLNKNLIVIPLDGDWFTDFYKYLLEYNHACFFVFRAGYTMRYEQYVGLLDEINKMKEGDAGIANDREEECFFPLVWKTKAVLTIPRSSWMIFPFKDYIFHHLYFNLKNRWTWKRIKVVDFIESRTKGLPWKKNKEEWELLYPILSAKISNEGIMNYPIVSVVLCTYNDASYLNCAIQSVLVQLNRSWELIIIDDGSTDNTHEVLSFYTGDPRIVVIRSEENKGKSISLNLALSIAKGEWFFELDADDWLAPECIEKMLNDRDGYTDEIFIYADYYEWIERRNKKILYSQMRKSPENLTNMIFLDDNSFPVAPRMYRVSFLRKIGGWNIMDPYEGRLYEDMYQISLCSQYSTHHVAHPLYHRRIRGDSITQRERSKFEQWREWFRGLRHI